MTVLAGNALGTRPNPPHTSHRFRIFPLLVCRSAENTHGGSIIIINNLNELAAVNLPIATRTSYVDGPVSVLIHANVDRANILIAEGIGAKRALQSPVYYARLHALT
jgi:hypothetical protein